MWSRRDVLGAGLAMLALPHDGLQRVGEGAPTPVTDPISTRPIPSTKEQLPGDRHRLLADVRRRRLAPVQPVMERFLALGGRVVDIVADVRPRRGRDRHDARRDPQSDPTAPPAWLATKVWTRGKQDGIARDEAVAEAPRSPSRPDADPQPRRLEDAPPTLKEWKAKAHPLHRHHPLHVGAFDDLAPIMRARQSTSCSSYSLADRAARARLLPPQQRRRGRARDASIRVGRAVRATQGQGAAFVCRGTSACTSWAQLSSNSWLPPGGDVRDSGDVEGEARRGQPRRAAWPGSDRGAAQGHRRGDVADVSCPAKRCRIGSRRSAGSAGFRPISLQQTRTCALAWTLL